MTQSTGYLHHWAWRPVEAKWCKYKEAGHARYAEFTPSECHGRECLMVHAQAGLEVDLEAVRQLLQEPTRGSEGGSQQQQPTLQKHQYSTRQTTAMRKHDVLLKHMVEADDGRAYGSGLLIVKLPGLLAGKRVDELREPWPPAE
eukprot:gene7357-7568_t